MLKKSSPLTKPKEKYFQVFFIAMACAAALFIPYMIIDNGYFLFYGDFNVQQVPFYKLAHEMIRSGNWSWSFGTDLGTNFIGSYTFYLLGSPFFWLTLPFPNDFVPHLIGPLLILKFSCAALTAYAFLTRFVKNKSYALIGGLLYAFSGFSVYNIFFNHFHEAIVYFPLLLLSLELLMKDNRRGSFAFVVFLCAISNYYFFFGMVIFTIIYFIFRAVSGDWKMSVGKFFIAALEAVIGVLMSAVFLLPSVLMVMQNSRVGSYLTGWDGLLYSKYQRYGYIFQCFFFPPDLPARPVFFPDADAKWSSVAGWLPVFGMTGVISYMFAKKGTWLKRIIITSAVFAFIPILNASFSAFNYSYYTRWFYMPVLMMVLATVVSLEDKEVDWRKGWIWTFFVTLVISIVIGFYPQGQYADGTFSGFGLYNSSYKDRFLITCAIALGALVIFGLLLIMRKQSTRIFVTSVVLAVCFVSVAYSSYFVGMGKQSSYDTKEFIIPVLLENNDTVELEGKKISDIDDCRFDVYKGMDNIGMFMGVSCIQAFHSVVSSSIFDYYDFVGVERVVGSRPEADENNYALRSFLSVKYLLDYTEDSNHFTDTYGITKMGGYSLVDTQDQFDIYQNNNYIPYGFTYDYCVPKSYADTLSTTQRQQLMLRAMVLDDSLAEKYADVLPDLRSTAKTAVSADTGTDVITGSSDTPEDTSYISQSLSAAAASVSAESSMTAVSSSGSSDASDTSSVIDVSSAGGSSLDSSDTDSVSSVGSDSSGSSDASSEDTSSQTNDYSGYTFETGAKLYRQDCKDRAATSCLTFETDNKGFTAVTTLSRDNLVFFSIPYDSGWSATVDGEKVEIEKANIGFMAVMVKGDAKAHTIRFDYTTPGLNYGIIISIGAGAFLALYILVCVLKKRSNRKKQTAGADFAGGTDDGADASEPGSGIGLSGSMPDDGGLGIRPTSYLDEFKQSYPVQKNRFIRSDSSEPPQPGSGDGLSDEGAANADADDTDNAPGFRMLEKPETPEHPED